MSKYIIFDVETQTDSPHSWWDSRKYGLSYPAPITHLAYMTDESEHVEVLTDRDSLHSFASLVDTNALLVAHNASFDIMKVWGHGGVDLPLGNLVWDTMTIARLLGIGEMSLFRIWETFVDNKHPEVTGDKDFIESTKAQRKVLSGLHSDIVSRYIRYDVLMTYDVFKWQQALIAELENGDVVLANGRKLHHYPGICKLVELETAISNANAFQATRGIKVDREYVLEQIEKHEEGYEQELSNLAPLIDASIDLRFLHYLYHIRLLLDKRNGKSFKHCEPMGLPDMSLYQDVIRLHTNYPNIIAELGYFGHSPFDKLMEWSQRLPEDMFLNIEGIIRDMYFVDDPIADFRTQSVYKYLKYMYEHKTLDADVKELATKKLWQAFFLFGVCKLPLPDTGTIWSNPFLVTSKTLDAARSLSEDVYSVALESGGFSTGKDSLAWYLEHARDDNPASYFRAAMRHLAKKNRLEEFYYHSELDGRLHSVVARFTATGRHSSSNPNLQNINMSEFAGCLVADDGYELTESDYSNAENVMGAMMSGDSRFARDVAIGDFHMAQTRIYWGALIDKLEQDGNHAEIKKLRTKSKGITFAEAYGAGAAKLASTSGMTRSEIEEMLNRKRRAYYRLYNAKENAATFSRKLAERGYAPYVVTWSGTRVFMQDGDWFKTWNYIQQGGVAEMVARAIVAVHRFLVENNYRSSLVLNIHDSLIIQTHPDEVNEVLPKIHEIMGEVVPLEWRKRTVPRAYFVSEVGPENARKWGKRANGSYLLPLDVFWNRWGVHPMPEGADSAPTWKVNETITTLEEEMKMDDNSVIDVAVVEKSPRQIIEENIERLGKLHHILQHSPVKVAGGQFTGYPMYLSYVEDGGDTQGLDKLYNAMVRLKDMVEETLQAIQEMKNDRSGE